MNAERPAPDDPRTVEAAGARGLLAMAAALLVLLAGAGILAVFVSDRPGSAAPRAAGDMAVISQSSRAALPPAPVSEIATTSVFAPPAGAEKPLVAAAMETAPPETSAPAETGLTPRLKPVAGGELESELIAGGELAPRRKPAEGGARLLTLGQLYMAGPDDAPPPFFFEGDRPGASPPAPPIAVALAGDVGGAPSEIRIALRKGETFVDALARAGVRAEDRNAAAYAFGDLYDLRRLRPGQVMRVTTAEPARTIFQIVAEGHEPQSYLLNLEFAADASSRIDLARGDDGAFSASKSAIAFTTRLASVRGRIEGSLYLSAKRIGAPDKIVADLASIFAYDVDFQREVFGGDEFEAVFEARYDENGRMIDAGDILYGRMKWRGRAREKGYYRFAAADGGAKADYFDAKGESAKRLLMKTPVDGARLSSGFGRRRHPISGYNKQHKGVDFAASRGTPIKAAGDGVVERADRYGGYGNYVRIRHGQGYKTAYAHMSGFAKGIRAGKRVEQGDVIGYVGSTGASTGPHLHYEVLENNRHVNPQKLKVSTGVSLAGADLAKFKAARDALDAMRGRAAEAEDSDAARIAENQPRDNSL